jgi:hypothetical protein
MHSHKDVNCEFKHIETFLDKVFFDKEHIATIWELAHTSSQLVSHRFWILVSLSSMISLQILNPKPPEGVGGEWRLDIHLHRKKIKFQDLPISPTQLSITKSTTGKGLYLT